MQADNAITRAVFLHVAEVKAVFGAGCWIAKERIKLSFHFNMEPELSTFLITLSLYLCLYTFCKSMGICKTRVAERYKSVEV